MKRGIIKEFSVREGYGFITDEEGDDFYFTLRDIHPKSKNKKIIEGKHVLFDIKIDIKGDRAVNIRIQE
ncbi:MAG: hypothetical protein Kow00108_13320 [Calditrichia bacterium]